MRKHRYRAWDRAKKCWIDVGFHVMGEFMMMGGLFEGRSIEEFNDVVLSQWTGLVDCHGKDIYEGDIVRSTRQHGEKTLDGKLPRGIQGLVKMNGKSRVLWDDGRFVIKKRSKRGCKNTLRSVTIRFLKLEVIGNMFEHPTLLTL